MTMAGETTRQPHRSKSRLRRRYGLGLSIRDLWSFPATAEASKSDRQTMGSEAQTENDLSSKAKTRDDNGWWSNSPPLLGRSQCGFPDALLVRLD
jgi:hypothetical protein